MPRQASSQGGRRRRFSLQRYSAVELLATLVLFLCVMPFVEDAPYGEFMEPLLMTALLMMSMLAVGGRKQTVVAGAVLLVPALAGKWVNHIHPHFVPAYLFSIFGILFIGFVVVNLLLFIMRAGRVDTEVLCAAISAYLMLGILWTVAYILLGRLAPDAFRFGNELEPRHAMTGFNALYFSFMTLSTVGYGDIVPVSKVARMLAVQEAIAGTFFMTVLVARLVSIYTPKAPALPGERGE